MTGRLERRKAQTRAALIDAARALLSSRDPAGVSIQEITDAADVGFGSFYNHFPSKQELFDLAVASAATEHRAMVQAATTGLSDPAEVLAVAVRITGRLPRTHPDLARLIDRIGVGYPGAYPIGDLRHARDVGRLCYDDAEVAHACVGGAVLGVLRRTLAGADPAGNNPADDDPAGADPAGNNPVGNDPAGADPAGNNPVGNDPADDDPAGADLGGGDSGGADRAADLLAVSLLRMFGLVEADARRVATRPLPELP
jgi:AcrR family transcriptional regulator